MGVPLGMLSAVYRDTWIDHGSRVMSVSGVAVPAFWLGLMLQLVIALHLGWLPLGGRLNLTTELPPPITHLLLVDAVLRGQWATLGDGLRHAVLPVVTLSFPALASILRVVAKLALRNAMIPTLTMIGLRYGWMLGGTLLVESVFDWPGIGLYAVNSALSSDFVPVMGVTLVIGFNFMLANLLVDLGYAWLDPRLRRTAA